MAADSKSQKIRVIVPPEFKEHFPLFITNRNKDVAAIKLAIVNQDWQQLKEIGHKLKGTCATFGCPGLGLIGKEIEIAAAAIDESQIQNLLKKMEDYLANMEIEFQ